MMTRVSGRLLRRDETGWVIRRREADLGSGVGGRRVAMSDLGWGERVRESFEVRWDYKRGASTDVTGDSETLQPLSLSVCVPLNLFPANFTDTFWKPATFPLFPLPHFPAEAEAAAARALQTPAIANLLHSCNSGKQCLK